MLSQEERPLNDSIESIIDFVYEKLLPLDEIRYLRADDFIRVFDGQSIDKINMINENQYNPIFEKFYEAYTEEDIQPEYMRKAEYIMKRIQTSGIIGCYTRNRSYIDWNNLKIGDRTFYGNYEKIEDNINSYGNNVQDLYDKAYDLCMLGRLREAYYIYIDLLDKCKEEQKWLYYFLTQINVRYISQLIKSINSIASGFQGIMYFGKKLVLFESQLLDDVGLLQAYADMPAEIKKYTFLSRLSTNNYYSDDIVRVYEESYKISSDIAKSNVTIAGAASYDRTEILMKDAINFIYNNRLIFSVFSEHKKFVRTTMHSYLRGKAERMKIKSDQEHYVRDEEFSLSYEDILLLIKNFKLEELQFLTQEVDLFQFVVEDEERKKFEEYVEYTINFCEKNFYGTIEGDRINMYIMIKEDIKSMCYLGLFFIKDKRLLEKYIRFLMEHMPEQVLDYRKRFLFLRKIKDSQQDISTMLINVVEDMLVEKIQFCLKNSNSLLLKHWQPIIKEYSFWLHDNFPEYKSERLTEICRDKEFAKADKQFLDNLLPIIDIDNIKEISE